MNSRAILQLEDDDNDVMFLEYALKAAQVPNPLVTVRDGQDAIDYLTALDQRADANPGEVPALVILDLKTPRRTGLDVLRWMRAHPRFRTMVAIILSASGNQNDVDAAYEAGVNAFLVKPAGLDKLTDMIRAICGFWLTHNQFATGFEAADQ